MRVLVFAAVRELLSSIRKYTESPQAAVGQLYDYIDVNHSELVYSIAKTTVIVYLLLLASSFHFDRLHHHISLGVIYYASIIPIALSLLLLDSRKSSLFAKFGAFIGVVIVFLDIFLGFVPQTYSLKLPLFTIVLMTVAIIKRGVQSEPRNGIVDTSTYPVTEMGIGLLILIASFLYTYRLEAFHLYGDEYYGFDTAAGFYHTGKLFRWDWIASELGTRYYPRAWPHTLLIAASFTVFGISEWSARFVSVIFGILTVPTAYFVVQYFVDSRKVALVTCLTLILYPNLISYFRWTRMYALLIPLFMLLTYLVFRALVEDRTVDVGVESVNRLLDRNLNFNIPLGILSLAVLYIAYEIHYNALLILATSYVFVLYKVVATGETKYENAAVIGLFGVGSLAVISLFRPDLTVFLDFLSPFQRRNYEYVTYLFQFPLGVSFGGLLFLVGLVLLPNIDDGDLRERIVFLYIICTFSIVFYVFIGDRYVAFAYIVHVVPFAIALITFAFFEFVTVFRKPTYRSFFLVLILVSIPYTGYANTLEYDNPYGGSYQDVYFNDPVNFSEAYGTIESNYDPDHDVVFGFALRDYYLRNLPEDTVVIDMGVYMEDGNESFYEAVRRQRSGWITWPTTKGYHIDPAIRAYIYNNFEQYHGHEVDQTNVEVFYFNESMTDEREHDRRPKSRFTNSKTPILWTGRRTEIESNDE